MQTRLSAELLLNKLLLKLDPTVVNKLYFIAESEGIKAANSYFWEKTKSANNQNLPNLINQTIKENQILEKFPKFLTINKSNKRKYSEQQILYSIGASSLLNSLLILEILNILNLLLTTQDHERIEKKLSTLNNADQISYLKTQCINITGISFEKIIHMAQSNIIQMISKLTIESINHSTKTYEA